MDVKVQVSGVRGSGRSHAMSRIVLMFQLAEFNTSIPQRDEDGNESISVNDVKFKPVVYTPCPYDERDNPNISTTKQKSALVEAHDVIYGDREKTYGDPGKNLRTIAEYWSVHLKAKYGQITPLTPDDVCVMMVLLKQARLATSPKHRDSLVDTIGYAALADRINVAEQEADKNAADINPYEIQTADKK